MRRIIKLLILFLVIMTIIFILSQQWIFLLKKKLICIKNKIYKFNDII